MRIFGFAGWSGSGKTTLIEQLIPRLVLRGLAVSLVKHAHHSTEFDQPGKDSYRHRHAGCTEVLVTSSARWALMHELRGTPEMGLEQALARLSPCDLVLIEGYKAHSMPKLEVWRAEVGKPMLHPRDPGIIGIAADKLNPLPPGTADHLPVFALSDIDAIATFVTANATADLIGIWIKLLKVPYRLLYPAILLFCSIGVYSINNTNVDIMMTVLFGLIGVVFVKLECEPAPLLLGFVLGPMMEENLRRALLLSRGDPTVFFTRPLSLVMLLMAAALVLLIVLPTFRKTREVAFQED